MSQDNIQFGVGIVLYCLDRYGYCNVDFPFIWRTHEQNAQTALEK